MGWQIVKNPETEKYQIFSSIVDAFILEREISRRALGRYWMQQFGQQGEDNFNRIMKAIDEGGKPYNQFTMTFKEAQMWHTHSTEHAHGSCAPKGSKLHPETCGICKDIKSDMERDKK